MSDRRGENWGPPAIALAPVALKMAREGYYDAGIAYDQYVRSAVAKPTKAMRDMFVKVFDGEVERLRNE